ncbi:alpha/beta hydrolase [Bordetella genomosp. 1]|uniref:Alpha/beta hydrolase n=1 Tax=Bordetella genomosp. 1 TaxID=1395607 RepID=A0A261S765_9BORD|nr:alpha/beta fold hydrolase [Bordetella genomosp. 1]OZI33209.1 alpha/beta hydrolase [Bordetella genomosp. 1]
MERIEAPIRSVVFADYRGEMIQKIEAKRKFQLTDERAELLWNSPQEWRPSSVALDAKPARGVLLIHGLGDSPWSFHDVAPELAARGYLVRTVLLPGHGTDPADMLDITAEDWQRVVYEQAHTLQQDVDGPIYLGGFSTGANLALDYAYHHSEVAGLMLFSPGFKSMSLDWLAPLASRLRQWVIAPGEGVIMQTPVRYMNVPLNGYAQFYRTSVTARRLLERPYSKPVFMVVAEHDSVLDTDYLLEVFKSRFTNPQSRLIWYGTTSDELATDARILVRQDRFPDLRISQFSHMGVLFSPSNPLYGAEGALRICLNGMDRKAREACERGAETWFSDWGYSEEGKVHARLTFNPYFRWQTKVMMSVFSE